MTSDHDGQPATVIKRVASWLGKQEFTMNMPTSRAILDAYLGFCQRLGQGPSAGSGRPDLARAHRERRGGGCRPAELASQNINFIANWITR
jgi:hypothetical protein